MPNKEINKDKIKKILVFRTDRIGDILLSIPAIRALKQSFPEAQISVIVQSPYACLLENNSDINEIITYDKKKNSGFWGTLKFIVHLRKKRFDLAVVLNPKKRSNIIAFLAGITYRLGYQRKWGFLLNQAIKDEKYKGEKHELEYNLDLVRAIGADTKDKNFSIFVKKEDEDFVDGERLIAIHPGSSCPSKRWPIERFAKLGYRLSVIGYRPNTEHRTPNTAGFNRVKIIIVGSKEEEKLGQTMERLMQVPVVNLTGKLNLGQLAALFKRCSLLISTDSGPVHLATAVGLRCLVIFGRNLPGLSPKRWGPRGKDDIVLHNPPDCSPCLAHNCQKGFECLRRISVEEVLQAAKTEAK